ncbi:MAG: hypothetical protein RQ753_00015 [Desulfurivibrionaceae bacterium]|nr:hypothetical protein [Desulfobulbales bacterium]MDT8334060.1 hypothetical protein [Desulfurivibrionaceae bacterium]
METFRHPGQISPFMTSHLADFFDHFGISFSIDGPQLEYFVFKKETGADISCSLTIALNDPADRIEVMTFYPGLNLHPHTRYLSAVCFFMVMQHFAGFHHLETGCRIHLNTCRDIFDSFYGLLDDFDFKIIPGEADNLIDIESCFLPLDIDTTMFNRRALPADYTV